MNLQTLTTRLALFGLSALILTSLVLPVPAEDWHREPPILVNKTLPKGKTLKTYTAPNKRHKLIILDEDNHGDFFYYSYYFFDGSQYSLINTYVALATLPAVTWKKDHVTFQARTPIGPDEVQLLQVEYHPTKKTVRYKILKTEKMEAAG